MRNNTTRTLAGVAIGAVVLSSCSLMDRGEESMDPVELMYAELIEEVSNEEVADCIVRLGQREMKRAAVSEIAADELRTICERSADLTEANTTADQGGDSQATVLASQPFAKGDDVRLDELWGACASGTGAACDELFEVSPIGSEYEQFGVSCGERDDILNCGELDDFEVDGELVPQIYREWEQEQDQQPSPSVPAPVAASIGQTSPNFAKRAHPTSGLGQSSDSPELTELASPSVESSRAEKVRAAAAQQRAATAGIDSAVQAVGIGSTQEADDRRYTSPEVAGQVVNRSDYELERNNPLATLDPAIAGLVHP